MKPAALPMAVVDQAIDWSVKLTYNRANAQTRQAFEAWLSSADEHRQAWARIQSLGTRFAGLPPALAMQAMEKLPEARLQRRQMLKLLSLFAVAAGTTWSASEVAPWQRLMADYSTRVGERRRWRLVDGSELELNTDSAVRLDFTSTTRTLDLLRGELYLATGHDPRPLQVTTVFGAFEALGTGFSVRLEDHCCRLAVTEGAVRLRPLAGEGVIAKAGETWQLSASVALRLPLSAADAAAWRDGLLAARDMPLAQLLAELGRYRNGYLGCDPLIGQRRVSGNFNLADIDATLAFLAQAQGLRVHSLTRYWVRLSA